MYDLLPDRRVRSASIATIARLPCIHTLANEADFLYATSDVAIWSCVEEGLAITACSCATLRPLFRRFLAQTRFSSRGRTASAVSDQLARKAKRTYREMPFAAAEAESTEVMHLAQRPKSEVSSSCGEQRDSRGLVWLEMAKDTRGQVSHC